jgi:hypothetical protein
MDKRDGHAACRQRRAPNTLSAQAKFPTALAYRRDHKSGTLAVVEGEVIMSIKRKKIADESGGSPASDVERSFAEFLLMRGGPFDALQRRMRLAQEHDHDHAVERRTLIFVAVTWGVPLLLSVLGGRVWGTFEQRPFLLDLGALARFLVAVGLLIAMERVLDGSLSTKLGQFARAPLIAPESMSSAVETMKRAMRRRDSVFPEAVCLALAIAATTVNLYRILSTHESSWIVSVGGSGAVLTAAGWWCLFISSPIFWFLLLRALWRHFVWSLFLRKIARLKLRLVATHPDGRGGLSFISDYPIAFTLFVLALSCVVGSALAIELIAGELSNLVYVSIMAVWLVLVLALFAFPLVAFTAPLMHMKQRTLLVSGAQATRQQRQLERRVLRANMAAPDAAEAALAVELPDANGIHDKARQVSVFLVSRAAFVPVCVAAVLPLLAAGVTKLPYEEIVKFAMKTLLF